MVEALVRLGLRVLLAGQLALLARLEHIQAQRGRRLECLARAARQGSLASPASLVFKAPRASLAQRVRVAQQVRLLSRVATKRQAQRE